MKSLSLYQERDSIIHEIEPINKLLYILTAILIMIIVPSIKCAALCMIISLLLLINAKVIKKVLPIINFSFIILISIIIIQGLFNINNKTVLFNIGRIKFYKEGIMYSALIVIRVINILCAFALLVLTTKPSDLIEDLVRRGLSPKIGYVLSSVLQIIPQMTSTMGTIMDAQRSRGLETEGKLINRIKAFFPLIGPVVMNSLIATRERAMALEIRAFSSKNKKTFLNETKSTKLDSSLKYIFLAAVIFSIIWRAAIWTK